MFYSGSISMTSSPGSSTAIERRRRSPRWRPRSRSPRKPNRRERPWKRRAAAATAWSSSGTPGNRRALVAPVLPARRRRPGSTSSGPVGIREALAQIDRLMLGRQRRHHREDSGADRLEISVCPPHSRRPSPAADGRSPVAGLIAPRIEAVDCEAASGQATGYIREIYNWA